MTVVMMTNEEKVNACIACAKSIMRKHPCPRVELDELINIGFIGINSINRKLAYTQAYLHMLQFICERRRARGLTYNGAVEDRRQLTRPAPPDHDDLLDLDYALSMIRNTEQELLNLKFKDGLTTREISSKLGNISHMQVARRINAIIDKLRNLLHANNRRSD